MIECSTPMARIRYIDNLQMQRDMEARKQAELATKRGPSYFLAQGLGAQRSVVTVSANIMPLVVPTSEVAHLAARKLSTQASKAAAAITSELKPYGLKVISGDCAVTRPFANSQLIHLCETMVCYIPYATKSGKGRLIVKMTNFASGVAVPTKDGILYKDVTPMRDTAKERHAFRVLGVHVDADGQILRPDPRFTTKGMAWSVDSLQAITDACKRRVAH